MPSFSLFQYCISLLIIYLSAIETLICHTEIEVDRVYFLPFCTKYDTRFSKYGIEFIVALSSTNAKKKKKIILRIIRKSITPCPQYICCDYQPA